jgi:hypothetical protein
VSPLDTCWFDFEASFIAISLLIIWAAPVKFALCSSSSPIRYHQGCLSNIQQAPQVNSLTSISSSHQPHSPQTQHALHAATTLLFLFCVFGSANLSCSIYGSLRAGFIMASLWA